MGPTIDATTLVLAVDSTQVNTAAAVLDKMAGAGNKAEAAAGKLTTASIAQGKALSGSVVPAAAKAAESLGGFESAAKKIGTDSARHIGAGTAELAATAAKADSATAAIRQLGDAAQRTGDKVQSSLAPANAPDVRSQTRSNVTSLFPADGGQTASGFAAVKTEAGDAAKSIDDYIQKLQTTVATNGMSVRETKLYELALQGATQAQLEAADAALRLDEGYQRGVAIGNTIRTTFIAVGIAAAAAAVSTLVATDAIIKQISAYQDLSEKVGDTASNLASLQLASDVSGTSIDSIATASIRLTAALSKTDDESKEVGAGITALGLNFQKFKQLSPVEQLDAVAKSMGNFANGSEKTAVAVAIFGRAGAEMLPFLTELNNEGERQIKLTDAQIEAADAYADSQAALTSEFKTFLRVAATEATPILTAVQTVLADIAKDEATVSTATGILKGALSGAVIVFQSVAILGSDVGFTFKMVGNEIGAIAAQLAALARLDFRGFSVISDLVKEDAARARAELDKFQAKIMSIGQPAAPADTSNYSNEGRNKDKPKLNIGGLTPDRKRAGDGGAAREASQLRKAALEQDLQGFRSALQAERDALALHDRLLQGEYRAGALSLREFYDDKRVTTAAAVTAQIAALDQERTRLEQYQRTVKDPSEKAQVQTRINKIGDQQEKIRVRAAGDVQLANQEEAASFKALGDAVTNYRANLLQLQGDEVGAAKLRAQQAIDSAGILARQSGGQISADDITKQKALTAAAIEFNEVQNRTGILAANGARAEEAFALAAEQSGLSLIDTERGIHAIRSEELTQLGALAEAARKLADASTDPRIKAFAADLTLAYARAADSIDPALNRLRAAQQELASGIASTLNASLSDFGQEYADRRRDANADIKSQKDEYGRKIDMLEGYLAQSQDKQDKARLRAKIKDLEAKKADAKGESKGGSLLKTISTTVLAPIGQQVFATLNKLLITDPLQNYIEAQLKGLTEGGGLFAGLLKDGLGIQADPKNDALLAQTAAVTASTSAIDLLANAARNAAGSIGTPAIQGDGLPESPTTGDFARFDRSQSGEQSTAALFDDAAQAQQDAGNSAGLLGKNALTTATDLSRLAQAAGASNTALSLLPNIIRLIQLSSTPAASGSSSGGLLGTIISAGVSYFGGGTGDAISNDASGSLLSATGDMIRGRRASGGPVRPNSLYEVNEKGPEMLEMGGRQFLMMGKEGGNIIAHSAALADGAQIKGARELGGPVAKNSAYRVNEKGPELLQVAGKQYLMMGSQPGSVQPTAVGSGKGGDTHITVQVTPPAGSNTATAQQWGATAGRQMQLAMRRNN